MVRYSAKVAHKAKGRAGFLPHSRYGLFFISTHNWGDDTEKSLELKSVLVLEFPFRLLKLTENFTGAIRKKSYLLII